MSDPEYGVSIRYSTWEGGECVRPTVASPVRHGGRSPQTWLATPSRKTENGQVRRNRCPYRIWSGERPVTLGVLEVAVLSVRCFYDFTASSAWPLDCG